MKELAAIFAGFGAQEVRTYLQSGNVVFTAENPEALVAAVTKQIAATYGYPGRIVLRSGEELRRAYEANPFARAGASAETMQVYFLADWPETAAWKGLDPERSTGDRFAVVGREVYLDVPQGMARTKLTNAYFDARLKTVSTARNWNTVGKLVEMVAGS